MPTSPLFAVVFLLEGLTKKAIIDGLVGHDEFKATNPSVLDQLRTKVYPTTVNPNERENDVCAGGKKLLLVTLAQFEIEAVDKMNKRGSETEKITISTAFTPIIVRRFVLCVTCMLDVALSSGGSAIHDRFFGNSETTTQGIYSSGQHQAQPNSSMHM